jgi:hypothetical protein
MKKSIFNVGSLFLAVGFFFISLNSYAQDVKLSRQERKSAREAVRTAQYIYIDTLLQSKSFVLEADFLQNQYGDRIHVTPLLNFIRVNSSDIVLQTGTSPDRGFNGVGGVTAQGTIGRYEIVKNFKSHSYYIKFTVHSNLGSYDVSMTVSSDNQARAEITGLNRGRLIYDGRLVSLKNSSVYKGWNSI